MKTMIVNSKIKQKLKTILGVIRDIVLDFILYFGTTYILTESTLYMQHGHQNTLYLKIHQTHYASLEEVKKSYDKQFITITTYKNVQNYYNGKCTYNIKT